jgi:hypothetical protein
MDVAAALVAYHSRHWIRVAVESYLDHFPGEKILVVDNNPRRGDGGWAPDCQREREWLASHPALIVIDNAGPPDGPLGNRTHGAGLDVALDWCRREGARVMVHLEPDCLVAGRIWRDRLLEAIDNGAWMAGAIRQCHGPLHPTPTAWRVDKVKASFTIAPWKGSDENHPRFGELVHPEALADDHSPMGVWIGWTRYWDTAHKAWFEAAKYDRAAQVEAPDFHHFWHGSLEQRWSESTLKSRYPTLGHYLDRTHAHGKPRSLDDCPHRQASGEGSERAHCQLVGGILGVESARLREVERNVCRACVATFPPTLTEFNPVIASLVFELAEEVIAAGGVSGCTLEKAERLRETAEAQLDLELP